MRTAPLEKTIQAQVVRLLRGCGADVYVVGTVRRRGDYQGTMQSAGLPDLLAFVPAGPGRHDRTLVAIEVKRPGGDPLKKLRPEQREFRAQCGRADVPHICGGVDEVLAFLQTRGLVKEVPHYRKVGAA